MIYLVLSLSYEKSFNKSDMIDSNQDKLCATNDEYNLSSHRHLEIARCKFGGQREIEPRKKEKKLSLLPSNLAAHVIERSTPRPLT